MAIGAGCLAGGALALVRVPKLPARVVAEQPSSPTAVVPPVNTPVQVVSTAPKSQRVAPPPAASSSATPRALQDLIPSPHDSPIESEATLRKAERLCIRDVADECIRVADAYQLGSVVSLDAKRASQYRNLAFKGYIRQCERNHPEACYALARMYLYGDGVKAHPAYAKNLMKRVVEVCRYKRAEICRRLVEEAPMPPRPIGH